MAYSPEGNPPLDVTPVGGGGDGTSIDEIVADLTGGTTPPDDATPPAGEAEPAGTKPSASDEPTIDDVLSASEQEALVKEATGPASARSSQLQKIIDAKFGGDEEAFVTSLYEQWNSSSRMAGEIAELKKSFSEATAIPEPEPEPPADVKWIDQELAALSQEQSANLNEQNQLLMQIGKLNQAIANLEGQKEYADDYSKNIIDQKIWNAQLQRDNKAKEWQDLGRTNKRIDFDKKDLGRQRRTAEREALSEKSRSQSQEAARAEYKQGQVNTFVQALVHEAEQYNLQPGSPVLEHMANVIRAEAVLHLNSTSDAEGPLDLVDFVQKRTAAYAHAMNITKRGSIGKLAGVAPVKPTAVPPAKPGPRPAASTAPQPQSRKLSANQARAWAAKILP